MPDEILYALLVLFILLCLLKLVRLFIYKDNKKSKSGNMISVAIIDKHSFFRKGISMLLAQQGFEVRFEASNPKEMIEQLKVKGNPDIVLLSTKPDGMRGVETVRWLQEYQPEVKILVMFMDPLIEHPETLIQAGANGSLAKTADPEEIKIAILEILNNGIYRPQRKHAYRTLNTF
jgi:DNA-binding NarL/FixJ family response regulator